MPGDPPPDAAEGPLLVDKHAEVRTLTATACLSQPYFAQTHILCHLGAWNSPLDIPSRVVLQTASNSRDGLPWAQYIVRIAKDREGFESVVTEHFRMSGVYWGERRGLFRGGRGAHVTWPALHPRPVRLRRSAGLTAMDIMGRLSEMPLDDITGFVSACRRSNGGYGGAEGHDAHLLYTLSAVQIMALLGKESELDAEAIAAFVASLQRPDGSFAGDAWGEVDSRFTYCALLCLDLLGRVDAVDVRKAASWVLQCQNPDGGFGCRPGGESHAGQVFVCVGALALAGHLEALDQDRCAMHSSRSMMVGVWVGRRLGYMLPATAFSCVGRRLCWWLCERQTSSGGLNGRPEKMQDVCYSWWCLTALSICRRLPWINREHLVRFILQCQDPEQGGISDRQGSGLEARCGTRGAHEATRAPGPMCTDPRTWWTCITPSSGLLGSASWAIRASSPSTPGMPCRWKS